MIKYDKVEMEAKSTREKKERGMEFTSEVPRKFSQKSNSEAMRFLEELHHALRSAAQNVPDELPLKGFVRCGLYLRSSLDQKWLVQTQPVHGTLTHGKEWYVATIGLDVLTKGRDITLRSSDFRGDGTGLQSKLSYLCALISEIEQLGRGPAEALARSFNETFGIDVVLPEPEPASA